MPSNPYKRLKRFGLGNPADFPDVTYRAREGRLWPFDTNYGLAGAPTGTTSPDARTNTLTIPIKVEMADANNMRAHILGFGERGGGGRLQRTLPIADPEGRGMAAVAIAEQYSDPSGYNPLTSQIDPHFQRVTNVDPSTLNGEAEKSFRFIIFNITFAHLPYMIKADGTLSIDERERYMTTMQSASSEYVQLDRSVIFWNETGATGPVVGKEVATGAGLIRSYSEIVTTWYRIPFDAYVTLVPKWRARLSTVNTAALTLPVFDRTLSFEAQCLLFQPWRTREHTDPRGYPEYDVELRWLYRNNGDSTTPKGWNHFLFPKDGNYYRVVWGDGVAVATQPVFPLSDHTQLFVP